jgi:predicted DNA-binding transcriptional regulator AlpA
MRTHRPQSKSSSIGRSPSASVVDIDGRPVDGPTNRLLTAKEVAAHVAVNVKRVYELGIPAVHISQRSLRWLHSDVLHWIEERKDRP